MSRNLQAIQNIGIVKDGIVVVPTYGVGSALQYLIRGQILCRSNFCRLENTLHAIKLGIR
jgi:hypothetical protein